MAKFIYLNKDFEYKDYFLRKNEIGMIEKKSQDISTVRFVNCPDLVDISNKDITEFDPVQTGDQFKNKVCNRCNRLLPVDNFQKNQNGKNNRTVRRPSCRDCRDLIDGSELSAKDKREWNRKKPNMIIWECPICKKRTIPGLTSKVVLDHNHKTGKPNAWICDSCNTGLGRFKDDISVMKEAIKYLEDYQNK